jgi:membrane associated rhomboid family serine protease
MVGASGAIGGVMGAYILLYPRVKVHIFVFFILAFPLRIPAYVMLGYWFGLQLISGITTDSSSGGVAFWAHVGGFLGGAILSVIFKDEELLCGHEYYGWSTRKDPKNIWEIPENKHKHE